MRIFVGLDLSDSVRAKIRDFVDEVRGYAPDVRWVTPESLHITLKFIGEKPDPMVKDIENALRSISIASFRIFCRGSGFFPTQNRRVSSGWGSMPNPASPSSPVRLKAHWRLSGFREKPGNSARI
jgi:RNA 2',3'-cyclic 3'-phosphodiesterase